MMVFIDNYCSFTYNQVHDLASLGLELEVVRNDAVSLQDVMALNPDSICISSGPCTPNEAGISLEVIEHFAGKVPILGICLGMQCIGQVFGGEIVHAKSIMHAKTSLIYHNETGLFKNIPNPFNAVRYHSLVIKPSSLPKCLTIDAWTQNQQGAQEDIMAVTHKEHLITGVQYHPESLMSDYGQTVLKNFLEMCKHG